MTTVEDNVLTENGEPKAAQVPRNGAHATDASKPARAREMKAQTTDGRTPTDEILRTGEEAKRQAAARLLEIDTERTLLVAFLGIKEKPKRGRRAMTIARAGADQIDDSEDEPIPAPVRAKVAHKKAGAKKTKRTARESKAISASSETDAAESKAVLTFLKNSEEPQKLAQISEGLKLDKDTVRRHLGNLREHGKVTTDGQARGLTYEAA